MPTTSICNNLIYHRPFLTRIGIKAKLCLNNWKGEFLSPCSWSTDHSAHLWKPILYQQARPWPWPEDFSGWWQSLRLFWIQPVCLRVENVWIQHQVPPEICKCEKEWLWGGTRQADEDGVRILEGLAGDGDSGSEQGPESRSSMEHIASCVCLLSKSVALPKKIP